MRSDSGHSAPSPANQVADLDGHTRHRNMDGHADLCLLRVSESARSVVVCSQSGDVILGTDSAVGSHFPAVWLIDN